MITGVPVPAMSKLIYVHGGADKFKVLWAAGALWGENHWK